MEYGLIGEHLPHSFSKEIHEMIGGYAYELRELTPEAVPAFMREADFRGINVTIPYKQTVIPFLDEIDAGAKAIGAVNTVVKRDGRLYGYNTDFDGMRLLIGTMELSLEGKKVLILGTGGTSKTAKAVAEYLGAAEVCKVSRGGRDGAVTYEDAIRLHADARIIINTTPCGMFPHAAEQPIDLALFPELEGLVDAVYNPLKTRLVLQAEELGVKASGGLYMLVAQAVCAAEHFRGTPLGRDCVDSIYRRIEAEKKNIVLIGMPASGKTTVGRYLAKKTGRQLVDTDEVIVKNCGTSIPELFAAYGEPGFRDRESEAVAQVAAGNGLIIATGGGAVLRGENVAALRQNGTLFFLDRPLQELIPTGDRPTANSKEKIMALYETRRPVYLKAADEVIRSFDSVAETADAIESRLMK